MLATRGEAQFFRGVRRKFQHPAGEPLRVDEFARMRNAFHIFRVWVASIFLVETAERQFETRFVGGLKFWTQALVLLQNWFIVTRRFEED